MKYSEASALEVSKGAGQPSEQTEKGGGTKENMTILLPACSAVQWAETEHVTQICRKKDRMPNITYQLR
jgi:hypothetical protein